MPNTQIQSKQGVRQLLQLGLFVASAFLFSLAVVVLVTPDKHKRIIDLPVQKFAKTEGGSANAELLVKFSPEADVTSVMNATMAGFPNVIVKEQTPLLKHVTDVVALETQLGERGLSTDAVANLRDDIGIDRWQRVSLSDPAVVDGVIAKLLTDPNVEQIERNTIVHVTQEPRVLPIDGGSGGGISRRYSNDYYLTTNGTTPRTGAWGDSYPDLWGLWRIDASAAWAQSTGSQEVIVAVSDTGIDYTHPDLSAQMWRNPGETGTDGAGRSKQTNGIDDDGNGLIDDVYGYDFSTCQSFFIACILPKPADNDPKDGHGHGTHVAGTIGATTNNTVGVAGINWQIKLMAVQGLNADGGGQESDLVNTIVYAVDHGADVINMSWGGQGELTPAFKDALDYAYAHGVVTVAAAGNSNLDTANFRPANHEQTLAIAAWCPSNTLIYNADGSVRCASTPTGARASFSNFGDKIDVAAPGVNILSLRAAGTDMYCQVDPIYCGERIVPTCPDWAENNFNCPNNVYYRASGTSMAAPHVSGVVALLRAVLPNANPDLIKMVLHRSAEDVLTPGKDIDSGYGVVQAGQAVNLLKSLVASPKSDLVVTGASARVIGNGQVNLSATVTNQGLATANNITFAVKSENGTTLGSGSVPSLAAQAQHLLSTTITLQGGVTGSTLSLSVSTSSPEWYTDNNTAAPTLQLMMAGWPQDPTQHSPHNPTLANIDQDAALEIIVPYRFDVYAWNSDGSLVPGWPISTGTSWIRSTAGVADVNNDGVNEVVVGTDGYVHVWRRSANPAVWEPLPGWPRPILDGTYYAVSDPIIIDIDRNGSTKEVIMGDSRGGVYIWRSDGTPVTGWPQAGTATSNWNVFGLVIEDLDGDGTYELISQLDSSTSVLVRRINGTVLPGWPKTTTATYKPAPAVADIIGDSKKEVIVSAGTKLYVWTQSAPGTWTDAGGWPKTPSATSYILPPVVADLTGDTQPEILVGSVSRKEIYLYATNGQLVSGWPKTLGANLGASPIVANLDGQGALEIIHVTANTSGLITAWRNSASPLLGWPQRVNPATTTRFFNTAPAVGDVDGDGRPEIVAVDQYSGVGVWKIAEVATGTLDTWPINRQNMQRTGRLDVQPSGGGGSRRVIPVE